MKAFSFVTAGKVVSRRFYLGRRSVGATMAGIFGVASFAYGQPAWYSDYEAGLEGFFREPSFERFAADEAGTGYSWYGSGWYPSVPSVRFVPFVTRFESDGTLAWSASWEPSVEPGVVLLRRIFRPAGRFDDLLAGIVVSEPEMPNRVHLGLFNGRTRENRFSLAFDLLDLEVGANTVYRVDAFPAGVTAVGQTHEGVLKMVLLDADGEVLVDRFYDYDFSFMPPGVPLPVDFEWRALPDGSGYQISYGNTLTRLDGNGDVVWARAVPGENPYFAPDGSTVFQTFVPGSFMDPPIDEMVTLVSRVDANGDLAWRIRVDDFRPVEGRSIVMHHDKVLLLGYPDRADGTFQPPFWDACKAVLLDAATGAVEGQAQLSIAGGKVAFPGVGGWTGQNAVVSFQSEVITPGDPFPTTVERAHLVKLDASLESAETRDLSLTGYFNHGILPLLNLFYDPAESTFFYSALLQKTAGEIDRTVAILMDDELNLEAECEVFVPGEVVVNLGDWVSPLDIPVTPMDVDVTVSDAETVLFPAGIFEIETFPVVTTDPCDAVPPVVTYAVWAHAIFGPEDAENPEISGPEVDLTGDGVTNLEAYIFGLDPRLNNDPKAGVAVSQDDEYLTLTFRRRANAPGYEVVVEGAYQLGDWTASVVMQNGPVDGQGMVTVTARLAEPLPSSPSGYLRVVIREE